MGCSTHRVPSWSKVAMRCSARTYAGLDWLEVARTKSRMAFFAGPSFHEGSGSSDAEDTGPTAPAIASAADPLNKSLRVISMSNPSPYLVLIRDHQGCRRLHTLATPTVSELRADRLQTSNSLKH